MGTIKVSVPYLRSTPSGYYWEPSRRLRKLGFAPEKLGKNLLKAVARAKVLNASVAVRQSEADRGIDPSFVRAGTVAWLIRQWESSPDWLSLRASTRKSYGAAFKAIDEWCGHYEPRLVTRKAIKAWQRELVAHRGQAIANVILLRLHKLFEMARDEGLLDHNQASRLGLKKVGGKREPWARDRIETVCQKAVESGRPSIRIAVLLAANLGQREADIIKMPRSRYDEASGTFDITQEKTATRVIIPATAELREALAAAPAISPLFVISETTGRPYKATNFQAVFRKICRAAGIPDDCHFRDLRHTMATMLGEAGCTDEEIRAVTGHQDRAVVARYVRPNSVMATNAIAKLETRRALSVAGRNPAEILTRKTGSDDGK